MVFEPGKSGNPSGRPKGVAHLARMIRERTGDGRELIEYALDVLRDPSQETRYRIAALEWLGDRGFGRALTSIEIAADVTAGPRAELDTRAVAGRLPTEVIRALLEAIDGNNARHIEAVSVERPALQPGTKTEKSAVTAPISDEE